jgi:HlyD family secretion protein
MTPFSQQPVVVRIKEKAKDIWTNHRKKTIVFTALAIFIIVLIIATPSNNTSANQYTVGTQNIVDKVVLSGRTESINSVDLGFADSGRVYRVYVTEGQKVTKGQVLAQLEMGDLSAQLTSAKAELTIAQANLQTINREQDARVETAKRNLFGNLEAYPDNVYSAVDAPTISGSYTGDIAGSYLLDVYPSGANTGFSIRYTGLEFGTTDFTTTSRVALGARGLFIQFPETTYQYANTKWIIPVPNDRSSEYATLKSAYDTAVAARNVALGNAGNNAALLQARVDQARASVNQIYSAMERRRINAPFSGTVSSVGLKEGESTIGISKDTSPGVSMLATDQYKVVIKVPEIDVARVSANTPVSIVLDAYGPDKVFPGTLTAINPAETIVDGVPVYEGTVLFTEKDDMIRSGMTSTVTIVIGNKENVVAVPGSYIREDKVARKSFVTIIDPINTKKKPEEREIKTGIRGSDGVTEIISGLEKGEVIVSVKK